MKYYIHDNNVYEVEEFDNNDDNSVEFRAIRPLLPVTNGKKFFSAIMEAKNEKRMYQNLKQIKKH